MIPLSLCHPLQGAWVREKTDSFSVVLFNFPSERFREKAVRKGVRAAVRASGSDIGGKERLPQCGQECSRLKRALTCAWP